MTAKSDQPLAKRLGQVLRVRQFDRLDVGLSFVRRTLRSRRRFCVPEIDVQSLDLFDQHQDRFAGCAHVRALVSAKTCSPGTQLVQLRLV